MWGRPRPYEQRKPVAPHIFFRKSRILSFCLMALSTRPAVFTKIAALIKESDGLVVDAVVVLLLAILSVTSHHKHWLTIGSFLKKEKKAYF